MTNVLEVPGFSGRRVARHPLVILMDAVAPSTLEGVRITNPFRGWFKLRSRPEVVLTRYEKAEYIARAMGYQSYGDCRHLVDDVLPQDAS